MTNIIILRSTQKFTEKPEIRDLGKAGRKARMFEFSRRMKSLLDFSESNNRVDSACNQAGICAFLKSRKRTDITNYHCNKKSNKTPTVRAKEKRRLGFKEPRI